MDHLVKKEKILYPRGKTKKKIIYLPGEKIVSAIGNNNAGLLL